MLDLSNACLWDDAGRPVPLSGPDGTRQPGDKLVIPVPGGPTYRWCPPGVFMMGDNEDRLSPAVHCVVIAKGFWIGEVPVLRREYYPNITERFNYPITGVTYQNCLDFAAYMTKKTGGIFGHFNLPTEEQWEYACRASSAAAVDIEVLEKYCWYIKNSSRIMPVRQLAPNAWGIYDMLGNIWERCIRSFDPTDVRICGTRDEDYLVLRGGAYDCGAEDCRHSSRSFSFRCASKHADIGFRMIILEQ